jgi:fructokinase
MQPNSSNSSNSSKPPSVHHQPRIGIDLGGTKIEALLLAKDGSSINRQRTNTPKGDYAATLAAICQLLEDLTAGHGIAPDLPVGIGTPGAVSFESGLIKNSNSTCLNGHDLATDLQAQLGRPVRIANDADCFALSEASDGAAQGAHSVLGVILGTGVGGGLVYEGKLLRGVNGICGEWGHNTLPLHAFQRRPDDTLAAPLPGQRRCYCGRADCIENWLAGPSFAQSYHDHTGQTLSGVELGALIASQDPMAVALLHQYCNLLALALSTVINIIDPAVIVLGGGMSNLPGLYELVPRYWSPYVFSEHINTRLVQAMHGDSSGVRGAAWLWP